MRVSVGSVRTGGMTTSSGGDSSGVVSGMMAGLPPWAAALLTTVLVLIAAAILGIIIGKLYASVKYPDPEKHSVLPPLVRVGFICTIAACSIWLFTTLSRQPSDDMMVGGEGGIPSIGQPSDGELEEPELPEEVVSDELEQTQDNAEEEVKKEEQQEKPVVAINPAT